MRLRVLCAALAATAVLPATRLEANVERRIVVFVSIAPQAYFVERVGGDRVTVETLVKPGHSPATYEPTPRQMAALSEARLFFRIGVPFENALIPRIAKTMASLRIVDTRDGITLQEMKTHRHDRGADHTHAEAPARREGKDPHIWTSPRLVKQQARTIAAALTETDPDGKDVYERHLAAFVKDLDDLDARLSETLRPVAGKTFMVFHPSWGYFADAYGLRQEPIEIEGKEPNARPLARLMETARAKGVKVIFVQPQFSRAKAQTVAEAIGGAVVPIDPLARDYIRNLESVAAAVKEALQ